MALVPPQFARPDADVSDGAWAPSTGADNHTVLGESTPSDADYSSVNSDSTLSVGLSSIVTPPAGYTQLLRYRLRGSPDKKLLVRLLEGVTVKQTFTHDPAPVAVTAFEQVITAAISDYADLSLEVEVAAATTPPTLAVAWGAFGTAANGTTSCSPAYPSGINALTSKIFCMVTGRSNTASTAPTMPAGWTSIGFLEGGTGTWGVDAGPRRVQLFQKDTVLGTETGTVTVSLSGSSANTLAASIFRVEVPQTYGIDVSIGTGADSSNDTSYSAVSGTALSFQANDLLVVGTAQSIDTVTGTSAFSASGITFGTVTRRVNTAITAGNDHRAILAEALVTAGSGTVAPTHSYTGSGSCSGPSLFARMRAVAPIEKGRITFAEFQALDAGSGEVYIEDFQGATVGVGMPAGWTPRWDSLAWEVGEDGSDKFLRRPSAAANKNFASWDAIDADGMRVDGEYLALLRSNSTSTSFNAAVVGRASGTGSTENGYVFGLYGTTVRIGKYLAGGSVSVLGTNGASTHTVNDWVWVRVSFKGSSLKVKGWLYGGSEPGSWHSEVTDTDIAGAGWVGFLGSTSGITGDCALIAAGTGTRGAVALTSVTSDFVATYTIGALVSDDANRADGLIGSNYVPAMGAGMSIAGNRFIGTNAVERASLRTLEDYEPDQFVEFTVRDLASGWAGGMLRHSGADGTRNGYMVDVGYNGTYYISKYINGVGTNFIEGTGVTWVDGDRFRGEVHGYTLKLFKNGVLVDSYTDPLSTYATGAVGLYTFDDASFDDALFGPAAAGSVISDFVATYLVHGTVISASDDFERADGSPGSDWTQLRSNACVIASGVLKASTAGQEQGAKYTAVAFPSQQSSKGVLSGTASGSYWSLGVRYTGSGGTYNGYRFSGNNTTWYISRVTAGVGTDLASGSLAFAGGNIPEIRSVGSTISVFKDDVFIHSVTDATYDSGAPGVEFFDLGTGFSSWSASNLAEEGPTSVTSDFVATYTIEGDTTVSFALVQSAVSTVDDPAGATFSATPTEGNLLLAVGTQRSGTASADSTITGTGWSKVIARDVSLGDTTYRRSLTVWWKVAGAGEDTAVYYDDGTANTKRLLIAEYTAGTPVTWALEQQASNDNGDTVNGTSVATGTTGSVGAGHLLQIGVLAVKKGGDTTTLSVSWASDALTSDVVANVPSVNTLALALGSAQQGAAGTRASTVTATGGANVGLTAGILVFSATTGETTTSVEQDLVATYAVQGAAQVDLVAAYAVQGIAQQDLVAAYSVNGAVQKDLTATYTVVTAVQVDLVATYAIQGSAQQDLVATYAVQGSVQQDLAAAYSVLNAAQLDLVAAYSIIGFVQKDLVATYTVIGAAQLDLVASYAVQGAVQTDLVASYEIVAAGSVVSDFVATYSVLGTVTVDSVHAYALQGSAQQDLAASYTIRNAVEKDLAAAYTISGPVVVDFVAAYAVQAAVTQDFVGAYALQGSTQKDLVATYGITSSVQVDLVATYAIQGSAQVDLVAAYAIAGSVQADFTASYWIRTFAQADGVYDWTMFSEVVMDLEAQYDILSDSLVYPPFHFARDPNTRVAFDLGPCAILADGRMVLSI